MKRFLAIYIGTEAALEKGWEKLDAEKRKALEASGVSAWMEWGTTWRDKQRSGGGNRQWLASGMHGRS